MLFEFVSSIGESRRASGEGSREIKHPRQHTFVRVHAHVNVLKHVDLGLARAEDFKFPGSVFEPNALNLDTMHFLVLEEFETNIEF
jgi:hypothetical protein